MKPLLLYISLLLISLMPVDQSKMEIAVIVDTSVSTNMLSVDELKQIYTLRKQNWSDGKRIYVADYKGDSKLREDFYTSIDFKIQAIKRIWLRAQFSGRTIPPKVVDTVSEMTMIVTEKPGTIGYIPADQVSEDVKVIATFVK